LRFFISLLILSTVLLTVEANCEDKVLMLIPKRNFRDEELFVPKEIIENSGYKIELVSSSKGSCFGLLGHKVEAAKSLDEVNILDYKAVVFIGGIGAKEYWHDKDAISLAKDAFKDGIILAAICIAPVTLANAGVLEGKRATVSDAFKDKIIDKEAIYTGSGIEVDGNIITASGPSSSEGFGYKIVELLKNR